MKIWLRILVGWVLAAKTARIVQIIGFVSVLRWSTKGEHHYTAKPSPDPGDHTGANIVNRIFPGPKDFGLDLMDHEIWWNCCKISSDNVQMFQGQKYATPNFGCKSTRLACAHPGYLVSSGCVVWCLFGRAVWHIWERCIHTGRRPFELAPRWIQIRRMLWLSTEHSVMIDLDL